MRYAPRAILAGGLGFAVSCVAACGGGAGLLSGDESIALSGQGNEISSAVQSGDCGAAVNASAALNRDVATLPVTVNPTLRSNLNQGALTIAQLAAKDCRQHTATTTSTPATTSSTSTTPSTSSTTTPTHDEQHIDHDHDLDDVDVRNHADEHGYFYYEHDNRWRGTQRGDHHRDWNWPTAAEPARAMRTVAETAVVGD